MRLINVILSASLTALSAASAFAQSSPSRNLILFVPDGIARSDCDGADRTGVAITQHHLNDTKTIDNSYRHLITAVSNSLPGLRGRDPTRFLAPGICSR
jgi:hypothetical protein